MNKIECFCAYKQIGKYTAEEKRKNEESNDK